MLADHMIVRLLKSGPNESKLPPQASYVRQRRLRIVIADALIAFERSTNRFDLNIIDTFTGSASRITTDKDGQIDAKFLANSQKYRKPIGVTSTGLYLLNPALRTADPISKKSLRHTAPFSPIRNPRAYFKVIQLI